MPSFENQNKQYDFIHLMQIMYNKRYDDTTRTLIAILIKNPESTFIFLSFYLNNNIFRKLKLLTLNKVFDIKHMNRHLLKRYSDC